MGRAAQRTRAAGVCRQHRRGGRVGDILKRAAGNEDVPTIGGEDLLFNHRYTEAEATRLLGEAKLVSQRRACIDCHTFFGNGAYYAPDLTRA